ncbi:mind the gap isoform X2 [Rhynchophorus ferrugineus]|uniref:mind the gap isoform X2 n=1 Tax=Rhynchophorus ferrugineus TaxID=354439 RepID=UPI003FCE65C9
MKCVSLLLFITIFGGIFHHGQSTCVLESDFGFIINCAFKKSGLFRVRNLGGVKAHIGLGFSLGDELGFKESISNTEINRRRSAEVSKMQAQLIQATQKQQEEKKAKLSGDKMSRAVSNLPIDVIAPLAAGAVVPSEEVPPFKPIPPAADRPAISKTNQPSLMGNSKISIDPSVMAVIAVPKKKLSSDKPSGFADRVLSTGDDKPVPQHSSNSLQNLLATNNVTDEALELALLQHQQSLIKRKKLTTTTSTTRRPVTSKRTTSVGKVMNAPKEYYPVGYDKNFDDNFAARVDLPDTSFYCGDQKHFPGLYADEDLGCMVFHVCALTDEGLIMKSFLCPESTLFDQAILKCNWWFYVDCKNSKKLYDSNIPISKSYQLMKALTFFSAYKKESSPSSSTTKPAQD